MDGKLTLSGWTGPTLWNCWCDWCVGSRSATKIPLPHVTRHPKTTIAPPAITARCSPSGELVRFSALSRDLVRIGDGRAPKDSPLSRHYRVLGSLLSVALSPRQSLYDPGTGEHLPSLNRRKRALYWWRSWSFPYGPSHLIPFDVRHGATLPDRFDGSPPATTTYDRPSAKVK